MRLVFHGGKCCGIKTIIDMGYSRYEGYNRCHIYPTAEEALQVSCYVVYKKPVIDHDKYGQDVSSDLDFFTDDAPQETRVERLDRLIEFCRRRRPRGVIEIALMTPPESSSSYYTQAHWFPVLEARGFKETVVAENSNSGNTVHVWHLVYVPEAKPKPKTKKASPFGA